METGKGVLFRSDGKRGKGEISFEGTLYFGEKRQSCFAVLDLLSKPHPQIRLVTDGKEVPGFLEMNANQQSRAEPDFMNFLNFDGQRYAAGAWVPRKKAKEPWFLLILRPATPENRMASKLPTLVEIRPVR